MPRYFADYGGLPPQTTKTTGQAVFTDAYAVIPRTVLTDIVASYLPHWQATRLWIIARPLTGFAETFSHYIMEVSAGGGSDTPEPNDEAESVLFVVAGELDLVTADGPQKLGPGGYAFLPPGYSWRASNSTDQPVTFHWVRKRYEWADGLAAPTAFFTNEQDVAPTVMPDTNGAWSTTRFVAPTDLSHDMHVNIVNFDPGGVIPFAETHVMEHGIYVLEGKAVYLLNQKWVEVEAGDYLWLRAFCPQACYAGGPGKFRYLLYKNVNRHMPLTL
jgi:(S)-ureidoglycine aminohydrolase